MKKNIKIVVFIAIMTIVGKLATFIRDIVLTYFYGASSVSDAFLVAVSIPTVLICSVGMAIYTCYIPLYSDLKSNNPNYIKKFNNNLVTCVGLLSFIVILIYYLFSEQIVKMFAVGFDDSTFDLTVSFANIMILSLPFISISYILQAYLQANGSFYLVSAVTVSLNICTIIFIIISKSMYTVIIAYGVLIGYALYIPYFGIPCYKKGFRYKPSVNFKDKYIRWLLFMMLPVFVGQIFSEINAVVDKSVASLLESGGVTALDYSYKIVSILFGIIAAPIATLIYPKISEFVAQGKNLKVKNTVYSGLRIVTVILVPATVGMVVDAEPIIELVYFHGSFTQNSVVITSQAVIAYAFCAIPIGLRIICEKVFYAKKNTKTPMINSAIGIVINIILDIVLVNKLQHIGIALATTISAWVTFLLFYRSLRRLIGDIGTRDLFESFIKIAISSCLMGIVIYFVNAFISFDSNIILIIVDLISGIIIYFIMLLILKEDIVYQGIRDILKKY